MKMLKFSSIIFLSFFFMSAFIPEVSAKGGHGKHRSSFGLSFNLGAPGYVVAPAPVIAAPVMAPAPVVVPARVSPAPAYRMYVAPQPYAYYYSAPAPVVVEKPYVQSGFSFSYRRY